MLPGLNKKAPLFAGLGYLVSISKFSTSACWPALPGISEMFSITYLTACSVTSKSNVGTRSVLQIT